MLWTIEKIYAQIGRTDKVATVNFKEGSNSYNIYGKHVTVVFLYNQFDREDLDARINDSAFATHGFVKAKGLLSEISEENKKRLIEEGIPTEDIFSIFYFGNYEKNTFHSPELRSIDKIEIPIHIQPKGQDLDWMYGFSKRYVNEGIGLSPRERAFYIAGKFYYEPDTMTETEMDELLSENGSLNELVEWEYLWIKYKREEIGQEGRKRLSAMLQEKKRKDLAILDKYLKETGSSVVKLAKENIDLATDLYIKTHHFLERRLNVIGKTAIYVDINSYLHIHMRHVMEMKVNKQFEHKDNFQWKEEDVLVVIKKVVEIINEEVQSFLEKNRGKRFSRYGKKVFTSKETTIRYTSKLTEGSARFTGTRKSMKNY